jgi:pSer/pThr/pTyr-binding forkhead associated (FHA) protein
MPRFTILHEGHRERSVAFLLDEIRIGRLPGVEIELSDPSVSRLHARIRAVGGRWLLEDAGSVNGTWSRGQRVRQDELKAGDVIAIQSWEIVFEPDDATYQRGLDAAPPAEDSGSGFNQTFLSAGKFVHRRP